MQPSCLDWENININLEWVHININLVDMDTCSGAVDLVPLNKSREFCRIHNAWGNEWFSDNQIESICPKENWIQGMGEAGTMVFYDPCRILHRGGHNQTKTRHILYVSYAPPSKFLKEHLRVDPNTLESLAS